MAACCRPRVDCRIRFPRQFSLLSNCPLPLPLWHLPLGPSHFLTTPFSSSSCFLDDLNDAQRATLYHLPPLHSPNRRPQANGISDSDHHAIFILQTVYEGRLSSDPQTFLRSILFLPNSDRKLTISNFFQRSLWFSMRLSPWLPPLMFPVTTLDTPMFTLPPLC
jgi:hypothetical protein